MNMVFCDDAVSFKDLKMIFCNDFSHDIIFKTLAVRSTLFISIIILNERP